MERETVKIFGQLRQRRIGPTGGRRAFFVIVIAAVLLGGSTVSPAQELLKNAVEALKQAFGGGAPNPPVARAIARPEPTDPTETRVASDGERTRQFNLVAGLVKQKRWGDVVEVLQYILDLPDDSVISVEAGKGRGKKGWRSLQGEADQLLRTLPAEVREHYLSIYEAETAQRWKKAETNGDTDELLWIVRHRFLTNSGAAACDQLAGLFLDRGEVGAAATCYERLWSTRSGLTESREWKNHASAICEAAGRKNTAAEIIAELGDEGDEPGRVRIGTVLKPGPSPRLDQWPMTFGNPGRNGSAAAESPFLVKQWSLPGILSPAAVSAVEDLVLGITDNDQPLLSTIQPLAVGGRLIYRTLRGLQAVDLTTGRVLWEDDNTPTAESILSNNALGQIQDDENMAPQFFPNGMQYQLHDFNATGPLASLLFRDGVYGQLSSDGRQVFALQKHATMTVQQYNYGWGGQQLGSDVLGRDLSSNQLTAYDIQTGNVRWRVGGKRMNETFDPPLAGTLFLGPPTPAGGDLFIIGERDNEIRLHCLDPRTGEIRWSQLLALAGQSIEKDPVRRMWPCLPAVNDDLVICPTSCRLVVAVDRHLHRIVWTHKLTNAPPQQRNWGQEIHGVLNFADRWHPAPPVLSNGCVVLTPLEYPDPTQQMLPELICLDAVTGEQKWHKDRNGKYKSELQQRLALCGVADDKLILIGHQFVEAVSINNGEVLWRTSVAQSLEQKAVTVPIPANASQVQRIMRMRGGMVIQQDALNMGPGGTTYYDRNFVSGLAVIGDNQVFVPLSSGQLLVVALADGKVLQRPTLSDNQLPLGNIVFHQGRMFSVNPREAAGFQTETEVLQRIATLRQQNAHSAVAGALEAEVAVSLGKLAEALPLLQGLNWENISAEDPLRARVHQLRWKCLSTLVRRNPGKTDAEFSQLRTEASSPGERAEVQRRQVDQHVAQQHLPQAFEALESILDLPEKQLQQAVDEGEITVRLESWAAGRVEEICRVAKGAERAKINAAVLKRIQQGMSQLTWDTPEPIEIGQAVAAPSAKIVTRDRFQPPSLSTTLSMPHWPEKSLESVGSVAKSKPSAASHFERTKTERLFEFHPGFQEWRWKLIRRSIARGEFVPAETRLRELVRSAGDDVAAAALVELTELALRFERPVAAANHFGELLLPRFRNSKLPDGRTVAAVIKSYGADRRLTAERRVPQATKSWSDEELTFSHQGGENANLPGECTSKGNSPYWSGLRLEHDPSGSIRMTRSDDGEREWIAPLAGLGQNGFGSAIDGGRMLVVTRGRVHVLSLPDRRVLWSAEVRRPSPQDFANQFPRTPVAITTVANFLNQHSLTAEANVSRIPAVMTDRIVAYSSRREVIAVDLLTGEELWRRNDLIRGSNLIGGDHETLVVLDPAGRTRLLRTVDGRTVEGAAVANKAGELEYHASCVGIVNGRRICLVDAKDNNPIKVRAIPLLTDQPVWEVAIPAGSFFSFGRAGELVTFSKDRDVRLVNLCSGEVRTLGQAPPEVTEKNLLVVVDDHRIYLMTQGTASQNQHFYGGSDMHNVPVNGQFLAFNRTGSALAWKQEIKMQNFVLASLNGIPTLAFMSMNQPQQTFEGVHFYSCQVQFTLLDKPTGRILFDQQANMQNGGNWQMEFDCKTRCLTFKSYNDRFLFQPTGSPQNAREGLLVRGGD